MFKFRIEKSKKKIFFFILISLIFSILFTFKFIKLSLINFNENNLLNYPSTTSINTDFRNHDIDMTFSVARRSFERQSIFQLGSNIYEVTNAYHHYASRGLGIFLTGFFLNFTSNNIYAICVTYLFFSFINFFLINFYFKDCKLHGAIFFSILSILFGSIIFGGILNPLRYFQYLKEVIDLNSFTINTLIIFTSLERVPNILINNIFIFLNFFLLKSFFSNLGKKRINILFICLFITSFIDGLVFLIFLFIFFFTILINVYKKKINNKLFVYIAFLFLILVSKLIFHIYNYKLLIASGNEKHGINLADFWTGNPRYALEIIFFPIIFHFLFFKQFNKKFKFEIVFFITVFFLYLFLYLFINKILASRITHRNFEILLAAISYKYIYELFKIRFFYKKNIFIITIFILHIIYVLLDLHFNLFIFFQYLFFIFLLFFFFFRKNKYYIYSINFIIFTFLIFFFISLYFKNNTQINPYEPIEVNQKKFFNWLNTQDKKTIISLNLGLLLNSELQSDNNVYISSITNVPITVNRAILQKRLNDIFYLYGFTLKDLRKFLNDYVTQWELYNLEYSFHKNNLALLNKIIFYENFQVNYNKKEPIDILINSYENYLNNREYININFFNTCVITKYDNKFIYENSFFSSLTIKTPVYSNDYLSVYDCKIEN